MKKLLILFSLTLLAMSFYACDEIDKILNPSDDLLIDKTVSPSTTETILSHGKDIQIIIPGGALSEDATFKVEKNTKPPAMTIDKMIAGNNTYKIKISGQSSFNAPIQIVINYSQSKLDENSWTTENIRGLIYANGNWAEATYTIDPINKKIAFSINSPSGKAKKNDDIPLADGEITLRDAYTPIDTGSGDNLLKGMNVVLLSLINSGDLPDQSFYNVNPGPPPTYNNELVLMKWTGDNFVMEFDSWPDHPHSTEGFISYHSKFKFNGSAPQSNQKIGTFNVTDIVVWYWGLYYLDSTIASMSIKDIPLTYTSPNKDTLIYMTVNASNSPNVLSYNFLTGGFSVNSSSETIEYFHTLTKSDLDTLKLIFCK